jgi:uncharacterized protein (UPF0332 family)
MTRDEARERNVEYLVQNAEESLQSAEAELAASRRRFAMNRVYYACFYAASAVLVAEGRQFVKHAGVRAAVHQYLVKPGRVSIDLGRFYDEMFEDRQEADYGAFVEFDQPTVAECIAKGRAFVQSMKDILGR